jgi:hypothetical protein
MGLRSLPKEVTIDGLFDFGKKAVTGNYANPW